MAGSLTDDGGTLERAPYDGGTPEGAPYAYRRTAELATAVAVALTGAVVVAESLTHDIGWNETGPGSGYFPFRVGLLLIGAAAIRLLQSSHRGTGSASIEVRASGAVETRENLRGAGSASTSESLASGPAGTISFVTRDELRRSLSVFWPTAALVGAMFPLGCYVPSGVYLAWMMRRHGGYGWLLSAAYGAAVMVAFFLVFDLWFRVPLAKGPLEALFSIY
jgi:putative tricarboxylic transport membrane protein